jgi:hypothetical protein
VFETEKLSISETAEMVVAGVGDTKNRRKIKGANRRKLYFLEIEQPKEKGFSIRI